MPLATAEDIAARLGRTLTTAEAPAVDLLLAMATALIADAADKTEDWAADLDPVPTLLRAICIELTTRALANPQGIASLQESLGAYSSSVRFRNYDGTGLLLTATEERLVRQAVYGTTTGSSTPRALQDRLIDLNEGRDVDEIEA